MLFRVFGAIWSLSEWSAVGIPALGPEVDGLEPKRVGNGAFHARVRHTLNVLDRGVGNTLFAR